MSDRRVLNILRLSGFYGVYNSGTLRLDHHLITALIERWRKETHTFPLVTGETTITLEDIAMMWHIPVEGIHVTMNYVKKTKGEWMRYIFDMVEWVIVDNEIQDYKVRVICLHKYLVEHPITNESTMKQVAQ